MRTEYDLTNKTETANPGNGFTLIELLVVMAVISLLLAILLPALRKARVLAKRIVCQSNMKQITIALRSYLDNNDGAFPQGVNKNHDFGHHYTELQ